MPIYGYRCGSCKHSFEVVQSINDEPVRNCPKCGGQVSKIFFPVGIAFKGSGFHVNDYKSPKRVAAERSAAGNGDSSCKDGGNSECSSCAAVSTSSGD